MQFYLLSYSCNMYIAESYDKDREYDKPWLSHSKKSRPKTADETSAAKQGMPRGRSYDQKLQPCKPVLVQHIFYFHLQ